MDPLFLAKNSSRFTMSSRSGKKMLENDLPDSNLKSIKILESLFINIQIGFVDLSD